MTTIQQETPAATPTGDLSTLPGSARRTLEALFRHPLAHNLEWRDVVALVERIGEVEEKPNREVSFHVAGVRHRMGPHARKREEIAGGGHVHRGAEEEEPGQGRNR